MSLSEVEKRRYARQIILPEVGEAGQEKLKDSKILVVGAGGLGSPALLYLAAAGVGTIGIADGDRVDLSNLQRQIIHETSDIDRNKTESAADALADLNPEIYINLIPERITKDNVEKIVNSYDLVVDGSDNIETRFLLHDTCFHLRKTYVSAAVEGFNGQFSVYKGFQEGEPCYRCLFQQEPPAETMPTCSENGILGPVTGVMGVWQAMEAIKEILQIGESLSGDIIIFDALRTSVKKVKLHKDPGCKLCGKTT